MPADPPAADPRADDADATDGDSPADARDPRLGSRILVTWFELTAVGVTGGLLGATVGGPPGFIVYLVTSLLSVGVLLYNVDRLVAARVRATRLD